jgi:hypothetical protein
MLTEKNEAQVRRFYEEIDKRYALLCADEIKVHVGSFSRTLRRLRGNDWSQVLVGGH